MSPKLQKLMRHMGQTTAAGPPPFTWTPLEITSATILHYLEGDSVSTTGGLIDTATDKGPGGRNYTAATTARPTLLTANLNGRDVMDFDGSTDFLSRSSTAYHPNQGSAWTRILVFKPDALPSAAGDYKVISSFNTTIVSGDQGAFTYLAHGSAGVQKPFSCGYGTINNTGADVTLTTNWQSWVTIYNGGTFNAAASFRFYRNNTLETSAVVSAGTGNSTVNEIGRYPGGSLWFDGKIAVDMLLAGQLSDAERTLFAQYVTATYGLAQA